MNYYPHHIGDHTRDTAHLSLLEEAVYRRMIDGYYAREKPLPADKEVVCRLVRARTKRARAAVVRILAEFFTLHEDGWHQSRCDREISAYQAAKPAADAKRENERERQDRTRNRRKRLFADLAEVGVIAPWNATTEELQTAWAQRATTPVVDISTYATGCTDDPPQGLVTRDDTATHAQHPINHSPEHSPKKEEDKEIVPISPPHRVKKLVTSMGALHAVDPQVLADWQELRKRKRAPITDTALAGIEREAAKAGISLEEALRVGCEFGWSGFRAEWFANRTQASAKTPRKNRDEKREDFVAALTGYRPGERGSQPTLGHGRLFDVPTDTIARCLD